jgi:tetratricopeptide (TPR) repeat protein
MGPDFFISRAGPDAAVAKQIAAVLESDGSRVLLQDWDFANRSFMERMHTGLSSGARVVALLSPEYLTRDHCTAEWQAAIATDPLNRNGRLIVLRIAACMPTGLLAALAYVDLVPVLTGGQPNPDLLASAVRAAIRSRQERVPDNVTSLFHSGRTLLHPKIKKVSGFLRREGEWADLQNALEVARQPAPNPVVVCGLGGMGKSTLVREAAYRSQESYAGIWWLDAQRSASSSAWDGIEQGLVELWRTLHPMATEPSDRAALARSVATFLSNSPTTKPWLLVYDNVEDEGVFDAWPPLPGVSTVATSRSGDWPPDVVKVEVKPWLNGEGSNYLRRESMRSDLTEADAERIATALGCMPLALRQAASYLRRVKNASADSYLSFIADHMKEAPRSPAYPLSVFATLLANARRADQEAPGALALLSLASFYGPDHVPYELFEQAAEIYPAALASTVANARARQAALGALEVWSLVEHHSEDRTFSAHRLVFAAAHDGLGPNAGEWGYSAVRVCEAACPPGDPEHWGAFARVLPHIHAVAAHVGDDVGAPLGVLLAAVGHYSVDRGAYEDAQPVYERALRILNSEGTTHSALKLADTLVGFSRLCLLTTRLKESDHALRQAFSLYERAHVPPSDPRIITAIHNKATFYHATKQYAQAEPLYVGAATFEEEAHGPNSHRLAVTLNGLASLFKDTGRFEEAERLFRRALEIGRDADGLSHPDSLAWRNNLAELYRLSQRHEEAEPLYRQALDRGLAMLGSEHPDLAIWHGNLALLYMQMGRLADAKVNGSRAVAIGEKALGGLNPAVIKWTGTLGLICHLLGQTADAQSYLGQALARGGDLFGPTDINGMLWRAAMARSTGHA